MDSALVSCSSLHSCLPRGAAWKCYRQHCKYTLVNWCNHRKYRSRKVAPKSYVRLNPLRSVVYYRMNQTSLRNPAGGCVNAQRASFQDVDTVWLFNCRRLAKVWRSWSILLVGVIYHDMLIVFSDPYCIRMPGLTEILSVLWLCLCRRSKHEKLRISSPSSDAQIFVT